MKLEDIQQLIATDESESLEFKKSTGQRTEAAKTVCAMLNGNGGHVLFGVTNHREIVGQQVTAKTLEDLANEFRKIDPQITPTLETVEIGNGLAVIVVTAPGGDGPYMFDGRAYTRLGATTQRMAKNTYENLLSFRLHPLKRWENQPAVGVGLEDLDHEEILRVREEAIRQRSISAGTSMDIGDILDRLELRSDGILTQAALVLFGKQRFSNNYPQLLLKMGRFRGTKITGDILHNRQEQMNAFSMMREGMAFFDRILPLASYFPKGKILREDRLPVPPEALREILLNAIIHRDYAPFWGYIAIAVFDDRIEIISSGLLPPGITVDMLSGPHLSRLRNPKIAQTFHRIGAIEAWGRGTNRVIEECKKYGLEPPTFREESGYLVVTFKAPIGPESRSEQQQPSTSRGTSGSTSPVPVQHESLEEKVLVLLAGGPLSISEISGHLGQSRVSGQLKIVMQQLVKKGGVALTIPDKPRSRLQKYRLVNRDNSTPMPPKDT